MRCRKCVLPESPPAIRLNEDGVCNICADFEKRKSLRSSKNWLESEFLKVLNKYSGKGKYGCLVMCSGGRDSTAALYLMKKRYKINPLAFTFDHGFENEQAKENVRNAVDILGVDWLYYKTDSMKEAFVKIIKDHPEVPICHICSLWYLGLTYDWAARLKTPLIIAGWTKGQAAQDGETQTELASMSRATARFVENDLRRLPGFEKFPRNTDEINRRARKKFKSVIISPHWYLDLDDDELTELLQREVKWKAPDLSYPAGSTNCLLNFIYVYLAMKHYGYTHYHVEMSKLIRLGEMSREEALQRLEVNFDRKQIDSILEKIGCRLPEEKS